MDSNPPVAPESEPVGYIIRRPTEADQGALLLFVTRPSVGMFGNSNGTAIFAVDAVLPAMKDGHVKAFSKQGNFMFSSDLPYLVIPRPLGTPVTTTDLARQQVRERKEWDSVMDKEDPGPDLSAVGTTSDGRLTQNPGQYL